MIEQVLNSSSNISTAANTTKHSTFQNHDAPQPVRLKMLNQICNMKFDNMVTSCLHLYYMMTG